jgi:hypothetical protein
MLKMIKLSGLALVVAACSTHIRSPDQYRDDTAAALDARSGEIKSCYDEALKSNKTAAGTVKVKFTIKGETGKIANPQVETDGTTAPPELQTCVSHMLEGFQLEPPDDNDGIATYTWEFTVGEAPPAPAAAEPAADTPQKKPPGLKSTKPAGS